MPSRESKPNPRVSAVVLAAGESSRFERSKLLEITPGGRMIDRVLSALDRERFDQVIVVASKDLAEHLPCCKLRRAAVIHNDFPEQGMSFSIRLGVSALRPVDGVMIVLADMPLVDHEVLSAMLDEFDGSSIVVPTYDSRRGNPVLFPWFLSSELLSLEGDTGGRTVVQGHPELVKEVEMKNDSVLVDIDTQVDLEKVEERLEGSNE
jgi:molybdenum cofactor cytidylyltransferase